MSRTCSRSDLRFRAAGVTVPPPFAAIAEPNGVKLWDGSIVVVPETVTTITGVTKVVVLAVEIWVDVCVIVDVVVYLSVRLIGSWSIKVVPRIKWQQHTCVSTVVFSVVEVTILVTVALAGIVLIVGVVVT